MSVSTRLISSTLETFRDSAPEKRTGDYWSTAAPVVAGPSVTIRESSGLSHSVRAISKALIHAVKFGSLVQLGLRTGPEWELVSTRELTALAAHAARYLLNQSVVRCQARSAAALL